MALKLRKNSSKRIVGVKSSSVAMFEGTFFAVLGLGIAIINSAERTVDIAEATRNVFSGLAFGLASGLVSIVLVPLIYFGVGWILGYIHGFVFNVVAEGSGGLVLRMEDDK